MALETWPHSHFSKMVLPCWVHGHTLVEWGTTTFSPWTLLSNQTNIYIYIYIYKSTCFSKKKKKEGKSVRRDKYLGKFP